MMFATMNAEEQNFLNNLQSSEATLRAEVVTMRQMLQQAMDAAGAAGAGKGGKGFGKDWHPGDGEWEKGRVISNRKGFALVDKFDGNQSKFKSWLFDLITDVGSVDMRLAKDL